MIYQLAKVLLIPVLAAQGIYVKRVTPRLPEPEGARSGVFGTGAKINLLIVGDSAAAGVGAKTQHQALSGRLVTALGSSCEVSWKLLAQTGNASTQVLAKLRSASAEDFDYVVVSVGVNDVTAQTGSKQWTANLKSIIDLLKSKFHARHIFLSAVPPMHLFTCLPQPLRWWLGLRAKKLNALMQEIASSDSKCTFLSIAIPAERNFMAADGFHPAALTYTLWGAELAKLIRTNLNSIEG